MNPNMRPMNPDFFKTQKGMFSPSFIKGAMENILLLQECYVKLNKTSKTTTSTSKQELKF